MATTSDSENAISKLNKKSSRLRIIGLVLIFVSFITFIVFTSHQGNKIQQQEVVIARKDSILSETKDSIKTLSSRKDSLRFIVMAFLDLRGDHNADSLEQFYADTVTNYFKNLRNVPKSSITKSDRSYWRRFPQDKFSTSEIILDSLADKAIVKGKQCRTEMKCTDEIVEIRFDKSKKITYVRAFYSN